MPINELNFATKNIPVAIKLVAHEVTLTWNMAYTVVQYDTDKSD